MAACSTSSHWPSRSRSMRLAPGAPLPSDGRVGYGAVIICFVNLLEWGSTMRLPALDPGLHRRIVM